MLANSWEGLLTGSVSTAARFRDPGIDKSLCLPLLYIREGAFSSVLKPTGFGGGHGCRNASPFTTLLATRRYRICGATSTAAGGHYGNPVSRTSSLSSGPRTPWSVPLQRPLCISYGLSCFSNLELGNYLEDLMRPNFGSAALNGVIAQHLRLVAQSASGKISTRRAGPLNVPN